MTYDPNKTQQDKTGTGTGSQSGFDKSKSGGQTSTDKSKTGQTSRDTLNDRNK